LQIRKSLRAGSVMREVKAIVTSGFGEAANHLRHLLGGIRMLTGLSVVPGTLNLRLPFPHDLRADFRVDRGAYNAYEEIFIERCLINAVPALMLRTDAQVHDWIHAVEQVEVMAAVHLRSRFGLRDGDVVTLTLDPQS
jgi:CTP-dependent riboflavin kinase